MITSYFYHYSQETFCCQKRSRSDDDDDNEVENNGTSTQQSQKLENVATAAVVVTHNNNKKSKPMSECMQELLALLTDAVWWEALVSWLQLSASFVAGGREIGQICCQRLSFLHHLSTRATYLFRSPPNPVGSSPRGNCQARSLSWTGTSTWVVFFGLAWTSLPTVTQEHVRRIASQSASHNVSIRPTPPRTLGPLGATRSLVTQYRLVGVTRTSQCPSETGLGSGDGCHFAISCHGSINTLGLYGANWHMPKWRPRCHRLRYSNRSSTNMWLLRHRILVHWGPTKRISPLWVVSASVAVMLRW